MGTEKLYGFGWQIREDTEAGVSRRGLERRMRRLLREAIGRADGTLPPAGRVCGVATLSGLALVAASILSGDMRPAANSVAQSGLGEARAAMQALADQEILD